MLLAARCAAATEAELSALPVRCLQPDVSVSPLAFFNGTCQLAGHLGLQLPPVAGEALLMRQVQELALPQVRGATGNVRSRVVRRDTARREHFRLAWAQRQCARKRPCPLRVSACCWLVQVVLDACLQLYLMYLIQTPRLRLAAVTKASIVTPYVWLSAALLVAIKLVYGLSSAAGLVRCGTPCTT